MARPDWAAWSRATGMLRGGGVDADHLGAEPGHRLGEEAAAAADVEEAEAGEGAGRLRVAAELGGDLVDDVVEAAGVQHVQRLELAVRVPPFGGHGLELGDLGGVNRPCSRRSALHVIRPTCDDSCICRDT